MHLPARYATSYSTRPSVSASTERVRVGKGEGRGGEEESL